MLLVFGEGRLDDVKKCLASGRQCDLGVILANIKVLNWFFRRVLTLSINIECLKYKVASST